MKISVIVHSIWGRSFRGFFTEMGNIPRSMALLFIFTFLIGTAIGSVLPEFGNVLACHDDQRAHKYNIYFLVIGVLGIVLALYLGF